MSQNNGPPGDSWGGNNKSPPDIDRLLTQYFDNFKKRLPGGNSTSFFIIFVLIL